MLLFRVQVLHARVRLLRCGEVARLAGRTTRQQTMLPMHMLLTLSSFVQHAIRQPPIRQQTIACDNIEHKHIFGTSGVIHTASH